MESVPATEIQLITPHDGVAASVSAAYRDRPTVSARSRRWSVESPNINWPDFARL
jgi:hypothetical protein